MTDKEFKTIDEQLEILKQRGLTIEDNTIMKKAEYEKSQGRNNKIKRHISICKYEILWIS